MNEDQDEDELQPEYDISGDEEEMKGDEEDEKVMRLPGFTSS